MDSEPRVVLTTAPDMDTARRLGRDLVEQRLAACVQLVPGAVSLYSWEGKVQEESEVLLLAKTASARVSALEEFLTREHPYETPECIAVAADRVAPRYAAWLLDWVGTRDGCDQGVGGERAKDGRA